MSTLGVVLLLLAAAPPPPKVAPRPRADAPARAATLAPATVTQAPVAHPGQTECGVCHATSAWTDVRFNHERTGFPLTGQHTTVTCKACHVTDFTHPLARTCVGCHRDVHAGDLGARCESCHDTSTWRSRVDADAHRRSNFPLVGGHAALPCTECHFEAAERRFSRAAVTCGACHQQDYARTGLTSINHAALGFDADQCLGCHSGFRFKPARYPGHDACFPLSGDHALPCTACHTSLGFTRLTHQQACSTNSVDCTSCHEHDCRTPGNETDREHKEVPGYGTECKPAKCLTCHRGKL